MNTKLALITVVYNNYDVLTDFFNSLEPQSENLHVFVADLSTTPQQYQYPPYATAIASANNGYAHGANVGIAAAIEAGYLNFAIINSDVIVSEHFVTNVLHSLATTPNSLIGGKIYYAKGFEYHADRYTPEDKGNVIWYAGGTIDWANMITHHTGVDEVDVQQFDVKEKTDFITGCFIAYTKEVYDTVGTWDESWFLYYEDTDFCMRASKKGVSIIYDPSITLWHKNAQSTGGSGSSIHTKYQERNRIRFSFLYAPIRTTLHVVKNAILSFLSPSHTPDTGHSA